MKQLVCIYCEGSDTKVAVVTKEKEKIKVYKAGSFDVIQPAMDLDDGLSSLKIEGDDLNIEGFDKSISQTDNKMAASSMNMMQDFLRGVSLNKSLFVPALTEPAIYYHVFEGAQKSKSSKVTQEIISDIQESKNVVIDKENLGYIELADKSLLSVFLSGQVSCINMINSLARSNGKRYYKIPTVKSAEISLAYYVSKRKKFFPDDQSLIVYIGKEYSKLIFLQGRKLKHIGSTLDIGTINLHTYDVYFSKILLEMENGGISALDNIIVCGEDDSENLILSFYGTFPEANVSRLEFDDLDLTSLKQDDKDAFSSYSVPLAVATEYFDELEEQHHGINLLPRYVKEDQKFFQFAWHGYAMLPILFIATFFLTQKVLTNNKEIGQLDAQIKEQTFLQNQNKIILNKISDLQGKISSFDQTKTILDSASAGTGVWSRVVDKISGFVGARKNLWLTKVSRDEKGSVSLEGYALSKGVLTDFAYYIKSAELKSVFYESLRDKNAYKFNLTFDLSSFNEDTE